MEVVLYLEMKQWGMPLVEGGLLQQPAWTWEIITMAGQMWDSLVSGEQDTETLMES